MPNTAVIYSKNIENSNDNNGLTASRSSQMKAAMSKGLRCNNKRPSSGSQNKTVKGPSSSVAAAIKDNNNSNGRLQKQNAKDILQQQQQQHRRQAKKPQQPYANNTKQ